MVYSEGMECGGNFMQRWVTYAMAFDISLKVEKLHSLT